MDDINITRLPASINGISRWAVNFIDLELPALRDAGTLRRMTLTERYARIVRLANKVGGRKYHNKSFGGGVCFTAYEHEVLDLITRIRNMQQQEATA